MRSSLRHGRMAQIEGGGSLVNVELLGLISLLFEPRAKF